MSYRTDRQRVHGLGTAGDGTHHWWSQRLTSIALVPLTLLFLFPFVRALGADWETVRAIYATPLHAVVAVLFLLVGFNHLRQGIQVVIEDYIHGEAMKLALLVLSTFFAIGVGIAAGFALLKMAFGG
jgi:succinate dehydrogenase / fumarate reductase membrane anchor subunit